MNAAPEVRVGQVWADNDPRSAGRTVEVIEIGLTKDRITSRRGWAGRTEVREEKPAVRVRTLTVSRNVSISTIGRETLVLLDRFRPIKTGYQLIKDVTP